MNFLRIWDFLKNIEEIEQSKPHEKVSNLLYVQLQHEQPRDDEHPISYLSRYPEMRNKKGCVASPDDTKNRFNLYLQ